MAIETSGRFPKNVCKALYCLEAENWALVKYLCSSVFLCVNQLCSLPKFFWTFAWRKNLGGSSLGRRKQRRCSRCVIRRPSGTSRKGWSKAYQCFRLGSWQGCWWAIFRSSKSKIYSNTLAAAFWILSC